MLHTVCVRPVQENPLSAMHESKKQRYGLSAPTVLLAEDDDDLRCVFEYSLVAMGYVVIPCADARAASKAFQDHGEIDVLLTDFEMPGGSGLELAREITSVRPKLPVVIVTGSTLAVETMREIQGRGWEYLSKPCSLTVLERTLTRLLASQIPIAQ